MREYVFEFEIGRAIEFDPNQDHMSVVADSPSDVMIESSGPHLILTTAAGSVMMLNVKIDQLNGSNIQFCASAESPDQRVIADDVEVAVAAHLPEALAALHGEQTAAAMAPAMELEEGEEWVYGAFHTLFSEQDIVGPRPDPQDRVGY